MTREWPSVGLLPTEKGKQFFSSAPPHKFHTVMKHVVVWNIALRLTVTQLISVLVPSLSLYSSTKIDVALKWKYFPLKSFSTLSARQHVLILIFQYFADYW